MWSFFVILFFSNSWVEGQNGRGGQRHDHSGNGWDIKLSVPGEPGSDYPTLSTIPRTSFSCAGKEPGYYADLETNCQVFRICTVGSTYGFQSFLCPNGTLFNQAVFVCDWWMNVNCKKSEELFNNNNDRFGNLKLGPQLMKDIKKMLTHPMRNPYDKTSMKSNLIVMQNYKPPFGQMYPSAALLANAERTPNNIYIPAQRIQSSIRNIGNNDFVFSASTPEPRYLPPSFNTIQNSPQGDTEVFQRQKQYQIQNNQLQTQNNQLQKPQPGNIVSNNPAGRFAQNYNAAFSNKDYSQVTRTTLNNNQVNSQYRQKQINSINPTFNIPNANNQRGQLNLQSSQFTNNNNFAQFTNEQQQFGLNRDNQAYTYNTPLPRLSNEIRDHTEAKQNLVSTNGDTIPPTIITRTLTFSRYVEEPKPGKPKSRVTVKTWIVKPKSKSAKLVQSSPTPYTYDRPTRAPTERLTDATTPYVYKKPSTILSQSQVISETEGPYFYSRPTVASKQVVTTVKEEQSYSRPTVTDRIILEPTSPTPSKASRLYLVPTTFKPAVKLYLPPTENESSSPIILARQYLTPNSIQQTTYYPSEQLRASTTTIPTSTYTVPTTVATNDPQYSISKQSRVNTNHNNLTFADILTKEKLDITVNTIVKDTSKVLNTASPAKYGQYKQDLTQLDYPEDNYLPPIESFESGENITVQTPTVASPSSRLIVSPSIDLEPPEETYDIIQNNNQLSSLPFLKESIYPTNTIERTVSLKISIPEKVASYLFKRRNQSDYDRLEILNTGSSNYLVLTNNPITKNTNSNFIPIGKLIEDKNSTISNSQALVFSLLADSINVAKEYNNYVRQDSKLLTPAQPQFQNVNNEQLAQITNSISQLTSSQYAGNGYNNENIISAPQIASNTGYQYSQSTAQIQNQQIQPNNLQSFTTPSPQVSNQNIFLPQFQNRQNNLNANYQTQTFNQKQLLSGQLYQLPVPDVTDQIYNRQNINQNSADVVQSNNVQRQSAVTNLNNNKNNQYRTTNTEVETIQSIVLPSPPARLQLPPTNEQFNIQENINNYLSADNTISAQIQDKIVGTIPHPLEDNKLVSYEKDQTYIVYTKANNANGQNIQSSSVADQTNALGQRNANIIQSTNIPNQVTFQFIPSIGYQLENEKEQQKILNAFQIDEFGNPRIKSSEIQNSNTNQNILTSNINYTVDHTSTNNQMKSQLNNINSLYAGPSSYSAPQSSIGNLRQNANSRLELEENNGYARITPARPFSI
ncbi:uncharacterized protein ACR2FA_005598 [Aphomia sociella]